MLQPLESRRLLSAAVEFEATTGVLSVTGSDGSDRIEMAVSSSPLYTLDTASDAAGQTKWSAARGNYVNVFDNRKLVFQAFLRGDSLRAINLTGAGGDDVLLACNFESPVTTAVYGDDGDDVVEVVNFGGTTGAQVYAGEGNDLIRVGGMTKLGFLVWGEGGNDTITGSSAGDMLFGDVDPTLVRGVLAGGDDVIYGGGGDDFLYGGEGSDQLYGQTGNDFLDGGGGSDMLDGGAGDDFATYDPLDKDVIDVEAMTK